MKSMALKLETSRTELEKICQRYHVRRLALFGSALGEDFGPDSDIDMLVEFEPSHTPGFAFVRLQRELSQAMGRQVDLHTYDSLSPYFRDEILEQSQTVYERIAQEDLQLIEPSPGN